MVNKQVFTRGLGELALAFSKEVDEYQGKLYFDNLRDLRNEDFAKAVKLIIQNNKFFPKIAEIRQLIKNSDGDVLEAWTRFREEIGENGVYGKPHFKRQILHDCVRHLGGWNAISYVERKDMPFLQRDFERVYKMLRQRDEINKIQLPEPAEKKKIMLDIIRDKENNV